jgi:hypothetical protein
MKFDVTFLATDHFNIDLIKNEDDFIEHYVFTDKDGYLSIESGGFLNSLKEVDLLVDFLFGNSNSSLELYNDLKTTIFDITDLKSRIITSKKLDAGYVHWLEETKRKNTMDEYGMVVCYIGYIQKNITKKFLLLIIRNEGLV